MTQCSNDHACLEADSVRHSEMYLWLFFFFFFFFCFFFCCCCASRGGFPPARGSQLREL